MLHGNKIQLYENIDDWSHSPFGSMKNPVLMLWKINCSNTFLAD